MLDATRAQVSSFQMREWCFCSCCSPFHQRHTGIDDFDARSTSSVPKPAAQRQRPIEVLHEVMSPFLDSESDAIRCVDQ